MTDTYPSAHGDSGNSGHVLDPVGGQRTRETFDIVWSFETDGVLRASPIVSGEFVIVGDMHGVVYGLNAIDGREHWRIDLGVRSIFASPAVADETVFVSGFDDLNRNDATTYALDRSTGDVQWTRDFGRGGRTAVATDGERVYVPTYDGVCRALAANTGETVWQLNGERYKRTLAHIDGIVIFGDGADLVALDAEQGMEHWRATLDGRVQTPPVVDNGRVYVITRSADQWCLDVATGEPLWHIKIGKTVREDSETDDLLLPLGGGVLDSKPVTNGESLTVSIYKGLVELDAVDGRLLGYYSLDQRVHDPLLVSSGCQNRLYGSISNNGMTELQLTADGAVQLRSTAQDTLDTVPAYAAGVFYVPTELDGIFAVA